MNTFNVDVRISEPSNSFTTLSSMLAQAGDLVGTANYGDTKWKMMLFPSAEKLRIIHPSCMMDSRLVISVMPYQWSELQRHKQIQPVGNLNRLNPQSYAFNAIALTANAVVETADGNLVFHRKKGGAHHGLIHSRGGYVKSCDIKDGDISSAVLRELNEKSELGLKLEEMEVCGFFGTPKGMPVILWELGIGAVYSLVRTPMTLTELSERFKSVCGEESLDKRLYILKKDQIRRLSVQPDIHPQTRFVVPTMIELFGDK